MATVLQYTLFELARRELLVLSAAQDHELTCSAGELWITLDGERWDVVLGPGESYRVEGKGAVVVSALQPSTLNVRHETIGGSRPAGAARLLYSLLNWEFPPLAALPSTMIR